MWNLNIANTLHWRDFSKPTIAQLQGYCIRGALILVAVCVRMAIAQGEKEAASCY